MAFSFNPNLSDPTSQVRQKIGDTNPASYDIQDETIASYLMSKSVIGTAAQLCWDLSAKYARMADVNVDDQMQRFSQISSRFEDLARKFDSEAAEAPVGEQNPYSTAVFVGGLGDCRGPLDNPCCGPYD